MPVSEHARIPPKNSSGVRIPCPQIHEPDFRFDG
jgi:hypothetical protein